MLRGHRGVEDFVGNNKWIFDAVVDPHPIGLEGVELVGIAVGPDAELLQATGVGADAGDHLNAVEPDIAIRARSTAQLANDDRGPFAG